MQRESGTLILWTALVFFSVQSAVLPSKVSAAGPDLMVGELAHVTDYSRSNSLTVISMTTVSCNKGDTRANWFASPSNQHPVIAQNMYRLKEGRMEQIGQAWVKHGFAALQFSNCLTGCVPSPSFQYLGVHCSDPYSEGLNRGPMLGARHEVNPVTGYFDGLTADSHEGHPHSGISHGLQVRNIDLANVGARYFVEGHYVSSDDALAGNGNNNVSYLEVRVSGSLNDWTFNPPPTASTVRESPAVRAWPGATFVELDSWPEDGRIIVAYKVNEITPGEYRYDYAVYNMNSDRGIQSFSVPSGFGKAIFGFQAVRSHDEPFSNAAWPAARSGTGQVTWATVPFAPEMISNPIRWGTMYNFSIETIDPPVPAVATLGRYKPGSGTDILFARVMAPAASDCNENGFPDTFDISSGRSRDDNDDGIPDECVFCSLSTACGENNSCVSSRCVDGRCVVADLLYGDADRNGVLAEEDLDCVADGFALATRCAGADLFPCVADQDITMDDVLAAMEAFDGRDLCCE